MTCTGMLPCLLYSLPSNPLLCTSSRRCRNCEAELSRLKSELRPALEMMLAHRVWLQQRMEGVMAAVQQATAELHRVPVPE